MVFTCLALSVFSTIPAYESVALGYLFVSEIIVVIWFTIEFGLRYAKKIHIHFNNRHSLVCVLHFHSLYPVTAAKLIFKM